MTDQQFNAFVRFFLDDLEEIRDEEDENMREEKLKKSDTFGTRRRTDRRSVCR